MKKVQNLSFQTPHSNRWRIDVLHKKTNPEVIGADATMEDLETFLMQLSLNSGKIDFILHSIGNVCKRKKAQTFMARYQPGLVKVGDCFCSFFPQSNENRLGK